MSTNDVKEQLDTANAAVKLLEPFLKRAENWRYGQRLVAGVALVVIAVSLVLGISEPRYTAAMVILVMGVSFLTRPTTWLTARYLGIKDEKGRFRLLMTTDKNAPAICLMDDAGVVRLNCCLTPAGVPAVTLYDATTRPRVVLTANPEAQPALAFTDVRGQIRLQLTLSHDQHGILGLVHESGQPALLATST